MIRTFGNGTRSYTPSIQAIEEFKKQYDEYNLSKQRTQDLENKYLDKKIIMENEK